VPARSADIPRRNYLTADTAADGLRTTDNDASRHRDKLVLATRIFTLSAAAEIDVDEVGGLMVSVVPAERKYFAGLIKVRVHANAGGTMRCVGTDAGFELAGGDGERDRAECDVGAKDRVVTDIDASFNGYVVLSRISLGQTPTYRPQPLGINPSRNR
jgi:hypothetical protein